MNFLFTLKGVAALAVLSIVCFIGGIALSFIVDTIYAESVVMGVHNSVGPILSTISTIFTSVSVLSSFAIIIILVIIGFNGARYESKE